MFETDRTFKMLIGHDNLKTWNYSNV